MKRRGLTLIEVLVVAAVFALLAALLIPYVKHRRRAQAESHAIGMLRTLCGAEAAYASANGEYGTWAQLLDANPPYLDLYGPYAASETGAMIEGNGYCFRMVHLDPQKGYRIEAVPVFDASLRAFSVDQSGVIRDGAGVPIGN